VKLFSRSILRSAALGAALALVAGASQAADITGAGATFPYPVYSKWADSYKKESGTGLNYQAIGSGGGINQIKAKTVTFGASDMPLKSEDLDAAGLIQFPMIMGGVVPVVNIPGVEPGKLVLDGDTIAEIYLGEITKWDDAKIKKLNPDLKLPDTDIAPAYRADGSGTTFLFTNYLSTVSAKFKDTIGASTSVQWPTGIGGKGNAGVAGAVQQTEGGIGYVEYAYVKQNKLTYTKMINKDGKTLEPTLKTFQAAASNADWANAKNYYVILTDQPGAESCRMPRPPPPRCNSSPGPMPRAPRTRKASTTCRCRRRSSTWSTRPGPTTSRAATARRSGPRPSDRGQVLTNTAPCGSQPTARCRLFPGQGDSWWMRRPRTSECGSARGSPSASAWRTRPSAWPRNPSPCWFWSFSAARSSR
jgi:phosphate transport system substrate-binding protein